MCVQPQSERVSISSKEAENSSGWITVNRRHAGNGASADASSLGGRHSVASAQFLEFLFAMTSDTYHTLVV